MQQACSRGSSISLKRALPLHFPMVEPEDEHRSVGKVEHGAGTEHPDQLAQS